VQDFMFFIFTAKSEEKKNRTKEEKQQLKVENEAVVKEFGWCIIDGHKQRIGNFKIEPPGINSDCLEPFLSDKLFL
jgi:DNA topoisomerase I